MVVSGGSLDLQEGWEVKDILCALRLMGEKAMEIPRRSFSRNPRKVVFYPPPVSPTISSYPAMEHKRKMLIKRLSFWCQDQSGYRVVEAEPCTGAAGSSAQFPLTTAEYQHGVQKVLSALVLPGDEVIEEEYVLPSVD